MAEIERKAQKVFGGNLSPAGNIAVYGSKLAGTVAYSKNLDVIQNNSWLVGLLGSVSPSKAPYLQDLNAIFYVITTQLAYLFQAGVAEWNAETEYFANKSFVVYNGTIYRAKANNTNIEPTVTANWDNYWETLDRFDKFINFSSANSTILGGYPLNAILDYVDENSGCVYKIKSLIPNNTHEPNNSNIRVSPNETGTFYWELLNNGFMPGAIIPFAGKVIPSGWGLCNGQAISRANYSFLFRLIGTTYGQGDGSTTFNLPNFRNKTFWGGDTGNSGTVKEAGLPNIKGTHGGADSNGRTSSGVFYDAGNSTSGSGSGPGWLVGFNASRSSSIYKDDVTTVQPPAIQVPFIIKY